MSIRSKILNERELKDKLGRLCAVGVTTVKLN